MSWVRFRLLFSPRLEAKGEATIKIIHPPFDKYNIVLISCGVGTVKPVRDE